LVTQVDCGSHYTYVRQEDGTLRGWGQNDQGQLNTPANLVGVTRVDCGFSHTYALKGDGTLVGWGNNSSGQRTTPANLVNVAWVACGGSHTYALKGDGTLVGWGSNTYGQRTTPANLSGVIRIACGSNHTYALKADGSLVGWGAGGPNQNFSFPHYGQSITPSGAAGVAQIVCGPEHNYALKSDGTLVSWGHNNNGQLTSPADLPNFIQVDGGGYHAYGLTQDGILVGWGPNASGETSTPSTAINVTQVACGIEHTYARRSDGTLVGWGNNFYGQRNTPANLANVAWVDCGGFHTYAVKGDGSIIGWGKNNSGQTTTPAAATNVTRVVCGFDHTYAVKGDGSIIGWGLNDYGQTTTPSGATGVTQVACGLFHSYALRSDGTLVGWGAGGPSQSVGYPHYRQTTTPAGATNVTQIDCGPWHTYALKADGTVIGWGDGGFGRIATPANLAKVTQVACGSESTIALLAAPISSCANVGGAGTATVKLSGSSWQQVTVWDWSNGGSMQVPGALTDVRLGAYGSVGSTCDARASTLVSSSGSTLLVPVDLSQPMSSQDHSIDVGGMATMAGRVWLLASGAGVLPADLDVGVLRSGSPVGTFDIVQTNVPPPAGKFLALVPVAGLVGTEYRLRLLDLPGSGALSGASAGPFAGAAIAAETMDYDHDGFDDLAIAIDFGPSQPGKLQVLLNDGSGNLGLVSVQVDTLPQPTCLATGDVDCDGRDDAVVGTVSGSAARVFLNNAPGSPAFTLGAQILPGGRPSSAVVLEGCASVLPVSTNVAVGTSTGGAGPSMVFAEGLTGAVVQSLPLSARPVSTAPVTVTGGRRIATGGTSTSTFDGESLLATEPGRVLVLAESSTGSWSVVQTIPVPGKPVSVDSSDVDGDGNPEIVTANADPVLQGTGSALPVLTLFRGGASGFGNAVPIAPSGASSGLDVSLVDIDGDGDRDLVSVQRMTGADSKAVWLRIDTVGPGGALTLGTETDLGADTPILCDRGNLDGTGGEDLYLVDDSGTSLLGTTASARPYLGAATSPACPGDLTADGTVDGQDLGLLLSSWNGDGPADLNGDGTVDGVDLGLMLSAWGACPAE
jgi:alpha-tubulin suppressor-like RCC1 family protein